MKSTSRFLSAGLAVLALALPQIVSAATPTLTDLGSFGGSYTYASRVNNNGQVIGFSALPGDASSASFFWSEATGTVQLPAIGVAGSSISALNDAGLVLGAYSPGVFDVNGNPAQQAFAWTLAGGYRTLGTLGGSYAYASLLNNSGQVVGYSVLAGDQVVRSFVWDAVNGMRDLGTLGGDWVYAEAINASGQIIGESAVDANGNWRPFIWDAAHGLQPITIPNADQASQPFLLTDSGTVWGNGYLTDGSSNGHGIYWWNAATGGHIFANPLTGTFAGSANYSFRGVTPSGRAIVSANAFVDDYGIIVDPITGPVVLVLPNGHADGTGVRVNAASKTGYAAGDFATNTGEQHTFVWDEVHGATDLGTLGGGSVSFVQGVNDRGEVTGGFYNANWELHAFIWDAANGMRDLGTLGGNYSYSDGISNAGVIGRSTLGDNTTTRAFFAKLNAGAPDLKVTTLMTTNNKAPQGQKVTITATVRNAGTAPAAATVTTIKDGTTVLGTLATPALAAGASATVSVDMRTAAQNGVHNLSATADAGNTVAESNETNNTATLTVTIKGNKVI